MSRVASGTVPVIPPPPEMEAHLRRQQTTVPYFGLGAAKSALPPAVHDRLREHLRVNVERFQPETERSGVRAADSRTIPSVYYSDAAFNLALGEELRPLHEAWCGMSLEMTACYGIRVYQRGAVLHSHIDHPKTHLISSTICIDHRLASPWPLYIEDINGKPDNVDLAPGELLFYEGARLLHGRPYPLDGEYYAGIFVHYRPLDRRP